MSVSNGIGLVVWVYLLISIGDVINGQTQGPNAVVSINGQTTLDCQTSFLTASTWIHTTNGSNDPLLISSKCIVDVGIPAYYSTTLLGGDICRLIIGNVTMQQAGVYDCNPGSAGGLFRSLVTVIDPVASLIVYNVSEVVENDQLNISCSISYTGPLSPAPWLRPLPSWTTLPGQNFTSTKYYPSTNIVTLVATVTVKKPTVPIFQCNTAFEIIGSTAGYNLTAPQDNFSVGKTIELDVQYGPSKPSSTSRASVITVSSVPCGIGVLTCASTANPAPNYRWLDSEGTVLSTSSILTLAEVNRTYKCEASNNIRKTWHRVSENVTVSEDNCSSSVQCCVFPHNDTTTVNYARDCENGTALCDCSQDKSAIILLCNVTTYPNASYMWSASGVPKFGPTNSSKYVDATANDTYRCLAYFDRLSTNYTGDVIFPNGTNDKAVDKCSAAATKEPTTSISPTTTLKTPISSTPENQTTKAPSDNTVVVIVVPVVVCYTSINFVAIGLFIWYYGRAESPPSGTGARNEAVKKAANKNRLNKRFPWLQKMLPCMNDTRESTGTNVLWVSLFVLLGMFAGIVAFPTLVILSIKYESNNETSALTKRENGGEGNEGVGSGRRPGTAPLSPNQTRAQGHFQNESTNDIELKISHQSGDRPKASPKPITSPTGKPPAPPNMKNLRLPDRANIYVDTEPGQSPEYAELPIAKTLSMSSPRKPVQYMVDPEDSYASLQKT